MRSRILKGGIFECLWRPLRRVWRLLRCRGPEIKLSVEETSPHFSGHSSVRPWWRSSSCLSSLRWSFWMNWCPAIQQSSWTYILNPSLKTEKMDILPLKSSALLFNISAWPPYQHGMDFYFQNVMRNNQGTLSFLSTQGTTICTSFSVVVSSNLWTPWSSFLPNWQRQ